MSGKIVMILIIMQGSLYAQTNTERTGQLKIGDSMNRYHFVNLINYQKNSASFADFKGKLLILDFWASTCGTCILAWPELLSLQQRYQDKIQIVLVNTTESKETVKKLIEKRKRLAGISMNLPVSCQDSILGRYLFPHTSVPFYVWIDADGVVRSISLGTELSAENIDIMLKGKLPEMKPYRGNDALIRGAFNKPLFIDGNGGQSDSIEQYSILSKEIDSLWPGYGIDFDEETGNYYAILSNYPIRDMYRLAYSQDTTYFGQVSMPPMNRVECGLADSSLYIYQLIGPAPSAKDCQQLMRKDLNRIFGSKVRWEKKTKPCLVFSMTDSSVFTSKNNDGRVVTLFNESELKLHNVTMKWVIHMLVESTPYYYSPYPLIDETGYEGLLRNMMIEADIYDYKELNKALQKYKMNLTVQQREVDVLIIE